LNELSAIICQRKDLPHSTDELFYFSQEKYKQKYIPCARVGSAAKKGKILRFPEYISRFNSGIQHIVLFVRVNLQHGRVIFVRVRVRSRSGRAEVLVVVATIEERIKVLNSAQFRRF
jgi:hypothetical protein